MNNCWFPRCELYLHINPNSTFKSWCNSPNQLDNWSTMPVEEVGLGKFTDCPNCTDAHAGCNWYSCLNIDQLHQLLKGWFKDHTRKWIVVSLETIYGQENGLELLDEHFSRISHCFSIYWFGYILIQLKKLTCADYNDMKNVWLAALGPLLQGDPDNITFIQSVSDFILIGGYHSHSETTPQYLQDTLSGIISSILLFLTYRQSHSMSKIPNVDSVLPYIKYIQETDAANHSDTTISEATHNSWIRMVTVQGIRVATFRWYHDGKFMWCILSGKQIIYGISSKQIRFPQWEISAEIFISGIFCYLTYYHLVWQLTSHGWYTNGIQLQLSQFKRVSAYQSRVMISHSIC